MDRQMTNATEHGRGYGVVLAIGAAVALGACLVWRRRLRAVRPCQRAEPQPTAYRTSALTASPYDEVDQESQDSFPASDPPSFTPVVGIGTPNA